MRSSSFASNKQKPLPKNGDAVDVSIACAFMILQAHELGLETCWIGAFEEAEVKKILNIPKEVRVMAMIPLGYPNQPLSQKSRKSLDHIVCFEEYK